ncbi:MAG: redoxin family protein [Betaproteobacteria bacterium]|nr:redoxin family protein [Betaproteobacteria bacterium]
MNRRIAWALVGAGILLAALGGVASYLTGAATTPATVESSANGASIHAESFPDVSGQRQTLAQWAGKPVLVNFWATWCAPCIEEIPRLNALHSKSSNSVQVIGIAADSRPNVERFIARLPIAYPVLVDEARAIAFSRRLGNRPGLLPYSVVLDPSGEVVASFLGVLDDGKIRQIESIIAKNLPKAAK